MRIQFLPDGSLFVLIITNKVVINYTLLVAKALIEHQLYFSFQLAHVLLILSRRSLFGM